MIFDAHMHIGFGGAITASVEELLASMDKAGVKQGLVFAGRFNECPNDKLIEALAPHRARLHAIGCYTPRELRPADGTIDRIDRWLADGTLVGLKFYLGYDHFFPADKEARPFLELLAQRGRPAIFHTGDCYSKVGGAKLKYAHPLGIDELAVDLPNLSIVMAHCGNPWLADAAEVCYKNPNVYADCSGFVCGPFSHAAGKKFIAQMDEFLNYVETPDKLIFGSDWPISDQSSYVRMAREIALGSAAKRKILGETARRLFGIKS